MQKRTGAFRLTIMASVAAISLAATAGEHTPTSGVGSEGGKPATAATIEANKAVADTLNFEDVRAFENDARGLIAEFDQATGDIIRNSFSFIDLDSAAAAPPTVNPSLWRQAVLNQSARGLYEVMPGKVYQVRGTDLASATFIRGETGWIVYDVLLTREAMAQSLKFFQQNVPAGGDLPIVAMIYSHSHADHFGGARAVEQAFPDVNVYGPRNMTKETVDENVLAGNAMSRRAGYQYGTTLKRQERGIVDAALAKGLSTGEITYEKPDYELNREDDLEKLTIDGIEMLFLDASGTEAASEMMTYIPAWKAMWMGELTYQGMHNIYTLRGAKVRDSLKWSKKINEVLVRWGDEIDTLFAAHSAPIWGNGEIKDFLRMQRDAYGFTHNQTLRLANNGVVLQDMGDAIYEVMPESIYKAWHTNGYHGTYSHNARAVYNMYLGYFDMNPANLNPLPTRPEARKFVEYMGGAQNILERARKDFDEGEYRFVATVLNKLVMAEPDNVEARGLLADTFEQLGYQAEGAGWRNIYLTGAQEVRVGGITPGTPKTASLDVIAQMDVGMLLDYFAVRVDSLKAQSTPFTMNVVVPDLGEIYLLEMSNGNLSNARVKKAREADATLTINKSDLTRLLLQRTRLDDLFETEAATITGDRSVVVTLGDVLVDFNPYFEIVPFSDKQVDAELYQR